METEERNRREIANLDFFISDSVRTWNEADISSYAELIGLNGYKNWPLSWCVVAAPLLAENFFSVMHESEVSSLGIPKENSDFASVQEITEYGSALVFSSSKNSGIQKSPSSKNTVTRGAKQIEKKRGTKETNNEEARQGIVKGCDRSIVYRSVQVEILSFSQWEQIRQWAGEIIAIKQEGNTKPKMNMLFSAYTNGLRGFTCYGKTKVVSARESNITGSGMRTCMSYVLQTVLYLQPLQKMKPQIVSQLTPFAQVRHEILEITRENISETAENTRNKDGMKKLPSSRVSEDENILHGQVQGENREDAEYSEDKKPKYCSRKLFVFTAKDVREFCKTVQDPNPLHLAEYTLGFGQPSKKNVEVANSLTVRNRLPVSGNVVVPGALTMAVCEGEQSRGEKKTNRITRIKKLRVKFLRGILSDLPCYLVEDGLLDSSKGRAIKIHYEEI